MFVLNPGVDAFMAAGCGRCSLGGTPACKALKWTAEMSRLRQLLLESGLTEELKWKVPCYTWQGKNIALIHAFKDYCGIGFFKGALLQDPQGILYSPGENSQASRLLRYTRWQDVEADTPVILAYIREAMEIESAGKKIAYKKTSDYALPDELQQKLSEDAVLRAAFEALTPGRQRSYILHISQAKQAQTRAARVEKCVPKILAGKGFLD